MRSPSLLFGFSVVVLAACSAAGAGNGAPTGADAGAAGAGGVGGSGGAGGAAGSLLDAATGDSGGAPSGPPIIYAHTDSVLFEMDPSTNALTQIGTFDCIGGTGQDVAMTDVAIDQAQALWGISANNVYTLQISGSSVHCADTIALNNSKGVKFYGLTFAPVGVLDASKEVLVGGNTAGELWSIDANGNLAQHGTLGQVPADDGNGNTYQYAGKDWELSGDIVFLANNGSPVGFATVRDCPNPPSSSSCDTADTLVEIDVPKLAAGGTQSVVKSVRGQILGNGKTFGSMYGIAAWNASVYGFARSGDLVQIDTTSGAGTLIQTYAGDKWAGAGVTTLASVKPPPPK